ncbi:MAG: NAD(P)H-hydrate epimerase [Thermomicrobiales bacterium]
MNTGQEFANCRRSAIPSVSADQMSMIDDIMINDIGVSLLQMMELAGGNLAHLARVRFLDGDPQSKHVAVLAGTGGNGGGGLVAARRLHGWCANVEVWLSKPAEQYLGVPAHQLRALQRLNIPIHGPDEPMSLGEPELIIDALIGYRLKGDPSTSIQGLIDAANDRGVPVLSLDLPSGLDATDGHISTSCIRATATLTLALPKSGLWKNGAHDVTGELYVADIGVPESAYARIGIAPGPIFARKEILRIG